MKEERIVKLTILVVVLSDSKTSCWAAVKIRPLQPLAWDDHGMIHVQQRNCVF